VNLVCNHCHFNPARKVMRCRFRCGWETVRCAECAALGPTSNPNRFTAGEKAMRTAERRHAGKCYAKRMEAREFNSAAAIAAQGGV